MKYLLQINKLKSITDKKKMLILMVIWNMLLTKGEQIAGSKTRSFNHE